MLTFLYVGKKYLSDYWKISDYSRSDVDLRKKCGQKIVQALSFFLVLTSFNVMADVALETSVQKVGFVTKEDGIT